MVVRVSHQALLELQLLVAVVVVVLLSQPAPKVLVVRAAVAVQALVAGITLVPRVQQTLVAVVEAVIIKRLILLVEQVVQA